MPLVQPIAVFGKSDEKLWCVSIWTCVGHTQITSIFMLDGKTFIEEFWPVYGFTTWAVLVYDISTVGHKFLYNPVKSASFVMQRFFLLVFTFFSCTESPEILWRLWCCVHVELELQSANVFASNLYIHENNRCWYVQFWTRVFCIDFVGVHIFYFELNL